MAVWNAIRVWVAPASRAEPLCTIPMHLINEKACEQHARKINPIFKVVVVAILMLIAGRVSLAQVAARGSRR